MSDNTNLLITGEPLEVQFTEKQRAYLEDLCLSKKESEITLSNQIFGKPYDPSLELKLNPSELAELQAIRTRRAQLQGIIV